MYSFIAQIRSDSVFRRVVFVILPLMHLTGFLGLQMTATQAFFKALVPFHLFTTLVLLLIFHTDWNRSAIFFFTVVYLTGFLAEIAGVHTGMIFGHYHYGATLGIQLWDVPLIIGANWMVLIYIAGTVANQWHRSPEIKALFAAGMVTGLDFLIEPVAIRLDFWSWEGGEIPFQNYAAWYLISFGLLWLFYKLPFSKKNKIAGLLLACQVLFFAAHNLTYILEQ
ncbi:MAG: carotenoid biosynthesis protein [Spirosomataceae bacterium]